MNFDLRKTQWPVFQSYYKIHTHDTKKILDFQDDLSTEWKITTLYVLCYYIGNTSPLQDLMESRCDNTVMG